jgi:hypothetical protein
MLVCESMHCILYVNSALPLHAQVYQMVQIVLPDVAVM